MSLPTKICALLGQTKAPGRKELGLIEIVTQDKDGLPLAVHKV